MSKQVTQSTQAPAAPPLSPFELYEALERIQDGLPSWEAEAEVEKAKGALAKAQAKLDRIGEQRLRIMRAKTVEEAKAIAAEKPADLNLKALCQRCSGWKPLQESGATDDQIMAVLMKGWPESRPYPYKLPSARRPYTSHSGNAPQARDFAAWVDPDKKEEGNPHLSGKTLLEAIRRVMNIPAAAKAKAPAKPPAKPTPKAKTTPAKKTNPIDEADDPAPAAKPSPKPGRQTWGQWAATLRGVQVSGEQIAVLGCITNGWAVADAVTVKGKVGVIDKLDDHRAMATVNFGGDGVREVPYGDLKRATIPEAAETFPFKKGARVIAHGQAYSITSISAGAGPNGVTLYDIKAKSGGKSCWLSNYYLKDGKVTNGIDELVAETKGKPAA